ncbi:30S ribosomal protein S8 [Patescibacteria group bacterium]|nr:30S ribosomal protein S8 [Patescibacteria group bacterium]
MFNDSISDLIVRLKNASMAEVEKVSIPHSKVKEDIAKILKKEGYLSDFEITTEGAKKEMIMHLSQTNGRIRPLEVKRISKPGRRVYAKAKDLSKYKRGLGSVVLSTPSGLMTGKEATQKNIGGEILFKII